MAKQWSKGSGKAKKHFFNVAENLSAAIKEASAIKSSVLDAWLDDADGEAGQSYFGRSRRAFWKEYLAYQKDHGKGTWKKEAFKKAYASYEKVRDGIQDQTQADEKMNGDA
ncbi:hypothetical protein CLAFUW4_07003 [Fulvia fulva]|uniref:Uncharacterized protein n=1 Tax=Passalora fulva TaxID=5499 RepID=A0A9Q8UQW6_PASFU|nr:uncharacterized protein CLAFUR5_07139 [Fulvia fulva]KAK4622343.1 hypothetical protein CLAFUR4_07012 [Fulvia fulva]KAK4623145.1 hypothetical protein CLAFUR0_07010 [Fulvia fulva]UJO19090.1 hypothetical protein CLAFUR5_07139 [Fulvia fulva]WPV16227.1 hypothetical protein CLAFUW4_07003 [Fulvia fulva]WPV30746.1 hypothetical protein CLAFUW7_07003 [Fulvia fulva]